MKKIYTSTLTFILSITLSLAQWTQSGTKLVGTGSGSTDPRQGWSVALSANQNVLLVGGATDNITTTLGSVWVYSFNGTNYIQYGNKLTSNDASANAQFGTSVSISDDAKTAVIGGPQENAGNGAAWIFTFNGVNFVQLGTKMTSIAGFIGPGSLGESVAISGNGKCIVFGSPGDNGAVGALYVFTMIGTNPQFVQKLVPADNGGGSRMGTHIAIANNGERILTGGYQDNAGIGAAWVFTFNGSTYGQMGPKLTVSGFTGTPQVGQGLDISDNGQTIILGGHRDNGNEGALWFFNLAGNTYVQTQIITTVSGASGSRLGRSLKLSNDGSTLVAGGWFDNARVGAGFIFTNTGSSFAQVATNKIVPSDYVAGLVQAGFSTAISPDGRRIILGGNVDNSFMGAAWVFQNLSVPACNFPVIVSQPMSQTVCGGSMAMLSVSATGTGLMYMWSNGATTAGINSSTAGAYMVTVMGTCGMSVSGVANVAVGCNHSLKFDGINDFVSRTAALTTQLDNITMEAWFKVNNTSGNNQFILNNGNSGSQGYSLFIPSGTLQINLILGGIIVAPITTVTSGVWHHIALTRTSGQWRAYLNGNTTPLNTSTTPNPITASSSWHIGSSHSGEFFNGDIDEVRFWTRPLSQNEVACNLYTKLIGNETGLLAYYDFDQGIAAGNNTSITQILDRSTNALHSTINNFAMSAVGSNFSTSPLSISGARIIPPSVTGVSANVSACTTLAGVVITVTATGTMPFAYQWYKDGNIIMGATLSGFNVDLLNSLSGGNYRCTVDNGCARVTSTGIAVYVPCNNALDFDGNNDAVWLNATGLPDGNKPYTLEAWINTDAMATRGIIGYGNFGVTNQVNALRLTNSPNGIINYWWGADLNVSTPSLAGSWAHVAATYDGNTRRIFVNGTLAGFDNPSPRNGTLENAFIGLTNFSEYFDGRIDEVKIWDRAIYGLDIANNRYKKLIGNEIGLIAYYDFDQGIAGGNNASLNILIDKSINNRTGTLTGFSLTGSASNYVHSTLSITGTYSFAPLTITGTTPAQQLCESSPVSLTCTILGTPGTLQWLKNGTSIAGATTLGYSFTLTTATSGIYQLIASNSSGSVTSSGINVSIFCNQGLALDGTNDYLRSPNGIYFKDNTFTVEAWVYPRAHSSWGRIMDYALGESNNNILLANTQATSGLPVFSVRDNSNATELVSSSALPLNTWSHVAGVLNGNQMYLYINGSLTGTATTPVVVLGLNRTSNFIGRSNWASDAQSSNIIIDEFRIWDMALTQNDINTNRYRNIPTTTPGLVQYIKFNEGTPNGTNTGLNIAYDYSPNGNNATLLGFALTGTNSNYVPSGISISGDAIFTIPTISGLPTVLNICTLTSHLIMPTVTGSYLGVQWYKDGVAVQGATLLGLNIMGVSSMAGVYRLALAGLNPVTSAGISINTGCQNALAFDGNNDFVETTPMNWGTQDFTIQAWVNYTGTGSYLIVSQERSGVSSNQFRFAVENGNLIFLMQDNSSGVSLYTTDYELKMPISAGTWHHIAVTRQGTMHKMYINGVQVDSYNTTSVINHTNSLNMRIGARYETSGNAGELFMNGLVDELQVWSTALSGTDIQANINRKPITSLLGMRLYYDFDQGIAGGNNASQSIVIDRSGNAKSGTFSGFALNGSTSNFVSSPVTISGGLNFAPLTFIGISPSVTVCSGAPVTLSVTVAGTSTWARWYRNGTLYTTTTGLSFPLMADVTNAGTWYAIVYNASSSVTSTGTNLIVSNVTLSGMTNKWVVCSGESATLSGMGATTYLWYPGSISGNTLTVSPTMFTEYTLAGFNTNGCVAHRRIPIDVVTIANQAIIPPVSSICGTSASITLVGTEFNARYTVRNHMDNSTIFGPTLMAAGPAEINLYSITSTMTYNVLADKTDKALDFDGSNDKIDVPYSSALNTSQFTVELWMKVNNPASGSFQSPLTSRNGSPLQGYIFYVTPSGELQFWYGDTGGNWTVINGSQAIANSWTHLAATRDGAGNVTFMINGSVVGVSTVGFAPNSSRPFRIGAGVTEDATGNFFFGGQIDEVRYWNVARSTTDIIKNMNRTYNGNEPNLAGYFPLNEGLGSFVRNGVTGIPHNLINMTPATDWVQGRLGYSCGLQMSTLPQVIKVPFSNTTITAMATPNPICAGQSATLTGMGGNTYIWMPGSLAGNNVNIMPMINTVYTLTGTDAQGCNFMPRWVGVTVGGSTLDITGNSVICAGTEARLTAIGANMYMWSTGATTAGINIPSTLAGIYTVTGTDIYGCTATELVTVTMNSIVPIDIWGNDAICSLSGTNLTATGAVSYLWNTGATTAGTNVNPLVNTSYTVTGLTDQGCNGLGIINVTVLSLPTINIGGNSQICIGNMAVLSATGATLYTWHPTTLMGSNVMVSPSITTTYSVSGTDMNGCTSMAWRTLTVNSLPVINTSNYVICSGQSATITTSGASTYSISGGSFTVSPAANTTYTISGTSAQGCVSMAMSIVTVNGLPTITASNNTICSGKSTTITTSGAITYSISGGSFTVSPTNNTTYTILGTSAQGCVGMAMSMVTVNGLPTVIINSPNLIICQGSSTSMTATGANMYMWSTGATQAGINITPPANSIYTVTGTDMNGCTDTDMVTVTVNSLPMVMAMSNTTITSGTSASLTASGANTYSWSTGDITSVISVSPTVNTTYTVTGTDVNLCANTASVVVSVLAVVKQDQTITGMNPIPTIILTGATNTYTLTGMATSGLLVSYSILGPVSVNGNILTLLSAGVVTVTAMQAGDANYNAAPDVSIVFEIVTVSGSVTGINYSSTMPLSIYPNPAGKILNVYSPVFAGEVSIVNVYGMRVISQNIVTGKNEIDINHLPSGIYILKAGATVLRFVKE
ncbi:MAG: LamG-like jellyroll fold domain-containing protein [Cytophagales bacterium]|nr:LamG-like jellyroll fold domain-containing protein [Cytophagales bacterium]